MDGIAATYAALIFLSLLAGVFGGVLAARLYMLRMETEWHLVSQSLQRYYRRMRAQRPDFIPMKRVETEWTDEEIRAAVFMPSRKPQDALREPTEASSYPLRGE